MITTRRSPLADDEIWIWSALLAAPVLMFANLGVTYALTPLLCNLGGALMLHLLCASCALPTIVLTVGSVKAWQQREDRTGSDEADADANGLPELASIVAALATLVVLAQWFAIWILPPCL